MPVLAPRKAKERQCFAVLLLRHLKSGKSRLSMPRSSLIVLGMLAGLQGENRNRSLVERVSVFFFGWDSSSRRREGFQAHTAPHCCVSPFLLPEPFTVFLHPNSPLLHRPKPRFSRIGGNQHLVSRYFESTKQNTLCKTNILWYDFTKEGREGICGI